MDRKKSKLTISGNPKKSIDNIELAKSQNKNSVVIEKKPSRFPNRSPFKRSSGARPSGQNTGFKSKSKTRSLSITKCPKCGNKCSRISRDNMDKSLNMLSFNLMKWKRYSCPSCYWEGNRWD